MGKLIIKFSKIDDENIEVVYSDNTKEILSLNEFIENNKVRMSFIMPK